MQETRGMPEVSEVHVVEAHIRKVPISQVVRQVAKKRTRFSHGNFRGGTSLR